MNKKALKEKLHNAGFTMAELLMVIAILAILAGVGFVAATTMIRNARQAAADKIAESIYTAAQNQLTDLYAFRNDKIGELTSPENELDKENPNIQNLAVKGNGSGEANLCGAASKGSTENYTKPFKFVLPEGSISEELRSKNIVVEYLPSSARVYAVYYSEDVEASDFYTEDDGAFALDDGAGISVVHASDGQDADGSAGGSANLLREHSNRLAYEKKTHKFIGYYQSSVQGLPVSKGKLAIEIGEPTESTGDIASPHKLYNYDELAADMKLYIPMNYTENSIEIKLTVTGVESKAMAEFRFTPDLTAKQETEITQDGATVKVYMVTIPAVIDSLKAGRGFREQFCPTDVNRRITITGPNTTGTTVATSTIGDQSGIPGIVGTLVKVKQGDVEEILPFIAGEDITLTAEIVGSEGVAGTATDNSLFAYGSTGKFEGEKFSENYTAYLEYGRHLQNLDAENNNARLDLDKFATITAKQVRDISFDTTDENGSAAWKRLWSYCYSAKKDNGDIDSGTTRTFVPITNAKVMEIYGDPTALVWNGDENKMQESTAADVDKWAIRNLTVALDGDVHKNTEETTTENNEEGYAEEKVTFAGISAKNNAGLFETFTGTVMSNIRLENPLISGKTDTDSATGGLAGVLASGNEVSVTGCELYMTDESEKAAEGNITKEGWLTKWKAGKTEEASDKTANDATDWLTGGTYAGGLIGDAGSSTLSIEKSFAATVVRAQAGGGTAGGLVGNAAKAITVSKSYADCYIAAGTESDKGSVGGLVGACVRGSSFVECYSAGFVLGIDNIQAAGKFVPDAGITARADEGEAASISGSYSLFSFTDVTRTENNVFSANIYDNGLSVGTEDKVNGQKPGNPYLLAEFAEADAMKEIYPYPPVGGLPHYGDWRGKESYYLIRFFETPDDTGQKFIGYAWCSSNGTVYMTRTGSGEDYTYGDEKTVFNDGNETFAVPSGNTENIIRPSDDERIFMGYRKYSENIGPLDITQKDTSAGSVAYQLLSTNLAKALADAVSDKNATDEEKAKSPDFPTYIAGTEGFINVEAWYRMKDPIKVDLDSKLDTSAIKSDNSNWLGVGTLLYYSEYKEDNIVVAKELYQYGKYQYSDGANLSGKSLKLSSDFITNNDTVYDYNPIPQYDETNGYRFAASSTGSDRALEKGAFKGYRLTGMTATKTNTDNSTTTVTISVYPVNGKNEVVSDVPLCDSAGTITKRYENLIKAVAGGRYAGWDISVTARADYEPFVQLQTGYYEKGKVGTATLDDNGKFDEEKKLKKSYYLKQNKSNKWEIYKDPLLSDKLDGYLLGKNAAMTPGYITKSYEYTDSNDEKQTVKYVAYDYIRSKDGEKEPSDLSEGALSDDAVKVYGGALRGYFVSSSSGTYANHDSSISVTSSANYQLVGYNAGDWKFNINSYSFNTIIDRQKSGNGSYEDAKIVGNAYYSYKVEFRSSDTAPTEGKIIGQLYYLPATSENYYVLPEYKADNKYNRYKQNDQSYIESMIAAAGQSASGSFRGFYVSEDDGSSWSIIGADSNRLYRRTITWRGLTIKRSYSAATDNEATTVDKAMVHVMVPLPGVTVQNLDLSLKAYDDSPVKVNVKDENGTVAGEVNQYTLSSAQWNEWQENPKISYTDHCIVKISDTGEEIKVDGADYILQRCTLYYISGSGSTRSTLFSTDKKTDSTGKWYLPSKYVPTAHNNNNERWDGIWGEEWDFLKTYGAFKGLYPLDNAGEEFNGVFLNATANNPSYQYNSNNTESGPAPYKYGVDAAALINSYGAVTYQVDNKANLSEAYVYADYYTYDVAKADDEDNNGGRNSWGVQVILNADDIYYDSIYPAPYNTNTVLRQYIGFAKKFLDGNCSGLGLITKENPFYNTNGTDLRLLESDTVDQWSNLKNGLSLTGIFVYGRNAKTRILRTDKDTDAGIPEDTIRSRDIYKYITEINSPVVTSQAEWYAQINTTGWDSYYYLYNGRRLYGYGKPISKNSKWGNGENDDLLDAEDVSNSGSSKFAGKDNGLGSPGTADSLLFGSGRLWNGAPSQNEDGSNIPVNSNFTVGGDTLTLNYVGDRQYICTKTTPNAAKTGTLTQTLFVTKKNTINKVDYAVIDYYINDIRSQYGKAAYFDSGKNRIYNKSGKLVRNLSELVGNRYYTPGGNYADYLFELNDGEHDGTVIQLVATGSDNASTNPTKPTSFTGYLWKYDAEKCTIKDYDKKTGGDGTASQIFTADADGNITYHLVVNSGGVYYNGETKRFYSVADTDRQDAATQINRLDNLASNWDTMDENSSLSGKTSDTPSVPFILTKHSLPVGENSINYYTCKVGDDTVFVADASGKINYDVNAVLEMQITVLNEEGNEVTKTIYYYSGKFYASEEAARGGS